MRGRKGSRHPRWGGGRWTHKGGYVYVYVPDHPKANRDGYVYEHRVVAEQREGRLLTDNERVHHLNGVKTDNRPENLAVIQGQSEHARIHSVQALDRYYETHDRQSVTRRAGKKGADARWGAVHRELREVSCASCGMLFRQRIPTQRYHSRGCAYQGRKDARLHRIADLWVDVVIICSCGWRDAAPTRKAAQAAWRVHAEQH